MNTICVPDNSIGVDSVANCAKNDEKNTLTQSSLISELKEYKKLEPIPSTRDDVKKGPSSTAPEINRKFS